MSSSSTFERKIVVFVGEEGRRKVEWVGVSENIIVQYFRTRSMRMRVLGFIGFSCAAQCFLCVFYPIFNDNFGKWVLTRTFLCLLLLHFSSSGDGVRDENAANYFNNVCKYFFVHSLTISPHREGKYSWIIYGMNIKRWVYISRRVGWQKSSGSFFNFNPFMASSCIWACWMFKGWNFLNLF